MRRKPKVNPFETLGITLFDAKEMSSLDDVDRKRALSNYRKFKATVYMRGINMPDENPSASKSLTEYNAAIDLLADSEKFRTFLAEYERVSLNQSSQYAAGSKTNSGQTDDVTIAQARYLKSQAEETLRLAREESARTEEKNEIIRNLTARVAAAETENTKIAEDLTYIREAFKKLKHRGRHMQETEYRSLEKIITQRLGKITRLDTTLDDFDIGDAHYRAGLMAYRKNVMSLMRFIRSSHPGRDDAMEARYLSDLYLYVTKEPRTNGSINPRANPKSRKRKKAKDGKNRGLVVIDRQGKVYYREGASKSLYPKGFIFGGIDLKELEKDSIFSDISYEKVYATSMNFNNLLRAMKPYVGYGMRPIILTRDGFGILGEIVRMRPLSKQASHRLNEKIVPKIVSNENAKKPVKKEGSKYAKS